MRPIDLKFKSIEAVSFNPNSDLLGMRIVVNDGKERDKAILKSVRILDPYSQAEEILADVKNKIKDVNRAVANPNDPLAGIVVLRILNKEEYLSQKIARFLAGAKERMAGVKSAKNPQEIEKKVLLNARMDF